MIIVLGSDKSGFSLKEEVKNHLIELGHKVEDLGMKNMEDFKAYYEVAPPVARKIQNREAEKGLLFCGTGMGMAIIANKFKDIYAAVVEGSYSAKMCKVINNANILTMGGWIVSPQMAIDMVDRWLNAEFTEEFPQDRKKFLEDALKAVKEIEKNNFRERL